MIKLLKRVCRSLFSRYTISAALIILEITLLLYIIFGNIHEVKYLILAICITSIPASLSLINKDTNPDYKVPWVFVIMGVPLFGPLIYVLFYQRRMSRRESKYLGGIFGILNGEGAESENFELLRQRDVSAAGKARALLGDCPISDIYRETRAEFFAKGELFFDAMIKDLREAKDYIFLEYFIISNGKLWDEIRQILIEKAQAGIDVRLLYDDIGCMKTLPSKYPKVLASQGIKARRFNEVNPRVSSIHQNRDHRKICVIDGKVGYTGGVNIGDEYINEVRRFGYWKDGGIRLEGKAVEGLLKLFVSNWDYSSRTVSDYNYLLSTVTPAENADDGFYLPFASGPAPLFKRPVGKNVFINLINQAERYVYITTPYLIIDYDLTEALRNAACRGVEIVIVTPGVADKKIIKVLTKSAYPYLIDAGVRIYEYRPGFIHEKTFVCDDKYAVVGTINFDFRSLVHHFENAVWIYGSPVIASVKEEFLRTIDESERMDKKKSRLTVKEWFFKIIVRIFAPLL